MGKLANLLDYEEFWILIIDAIVSAVLYFVGRYAVPAIAEDVTVIIGLMQPIALFVVAAIAKVKAAKVQALSRMIWDDEEMRLVIERIQKI